MTQPCDADSAFNVAQRAEYRRVSRLTRAFSASVLNPWERSHQLRDPFYMREAWCNGRFHFYEAKVVGETFERVTTDCPRWKPGSDVPRET